MRVQFIICDSSCLNECRNQLDRRQAGELLGNGAFSDAGMAAAFAVEEGDGFCTSSADALAEANCVEILHFTDHT